MRCKGGNDYIEYINNILECQQEEMLTFGSSYELLLFEDVEDMVSAIKEKIQKEGLYDIEIENKYEVNNAHKYIWNTTQRDWINSENSINEIGCIHTTQGYDLNYAFVILGKDIGYDKNTKQIIVRKELYFDQNGKRSTTYEQLLEYIKNIYYVLMTRGIKGTFLYVCDDDLREYLSQYIEVEN